MPLARSHDDRLDCGAVTTAGAPARFVRVGPAGTPSMLPIESARFSVRTAEGSAAVTSAGFRLHATLDEREWFPVGDAVTGEGMSALTDVRGYAAVRAQVVTAQSGVFASVSVLASSSRPDDTIVGP